MAADLAAQLQALGESKAALRAQLEEAERGEASLLAQLRALDQGADLADETAAVVAEPRLNVPSRRHRRSSVRQKLEQTSAMAQRAHLRKLALLRKQCESFIALAIARDDVALTNAVEQWQASAGFYRGESVAAFSSSASDNATLSPAAVNSVLRLMHICDKFFAPEPHRGDRHALGAAPSLGAGGAAETARTDALLRHQIENKRHKAAAAFLRDSRRGRLRPERFSRSKLVGGVRNCALLWSWVRHSKWWKWFGFLLVVAHMGLVALEPPRGAPDSTVLGVVEGGILAVFLIDVGVYRRAFTNRYMIFRWQRLIYIVVTLTLTADWALAYGGACSVRFGRALRPVLLLVKSRELNRMVISIAHTLPKVLDVGLVFVILLLFYAVWAVLLFDDEQTQAWYELATPHEGFQSVRVGLASLFDLSTTENFPLIGYPALQEHPVWAVVFFGSFVVLFQFLALPLVLAVVYDTYKRSLDEASVEEQLRSQLSLLAAFHNVADHTNCLPGEGTVSFGAWSAMIMQTGITRDEATLKAMFAVLRAARPDLPPPPRGQLDVQHFLAMDPEFLHLRFSSVRLRKWAREHRFLSPLLYGSRVVARLVATRAFQHAAFGLMVAYVLALVAESGEFDNRLHDDEDAATLVRFLFIVWFITEMLLKIMANGLGFFWSSFANLFDFTLITLLTFMELGELISESVGQASDSVNREVTILVRAGMVLRLVSLQPRFAVLAQAVADTTTVFSQTVVLLLLAMYSWAVLGMQIFGDAVPPLTQDVEQVTQQHASFDSFDSAVANMFQLASGNDWNAIAWANAEATSPFAIWFFISFFVLVSMIVVNILTGVLIEAFHEAQLNKLAQERADPSDDRALKSQSIKAIASPRPGTSPGASAAARNGLLQRVMTQRSVFSTDEAAAAGEDFELPEVLSPMVRTPRSSSAAQLLAGRGRTSTSAAVVSTTASRPLVDMPAPIVPEQSNPMHSGR